MDIASASRPKVIPFQGVIDSASDEDDDVPNGDLLPHHVQARHHARVAGDSSRGLGGRLRSRVRGKHISFTFLSSYLKFAFSYRPHLQMAYNAPSTPGYP